MKLLIKGGHIENAVNLWSRHATPKRFVHLLLRGVSGRGVLNNVDPAATGLFIFGHPTLGNWTSVPSQFKLVGGTVGHAYSGITPDVPPAPMSAEDFSALNIVELYVLGHIRAFINGQDASGGDFCGVAWSGTSGESFRNALLPAARVWQTGDDWGAVDSKYKHADGSPRIDPDAVLRDIATVTI